MIFLCLYHLILSFFFINVHAQTSDLSSQDKSNGSSAVVIDIISVLFLIFFLLLLYANFCHCQRRPTAAVNNNRFRIYDGLLRSRPRFSGIYKSVIEAIPSFKFSSLKGSKEGLDCVICLSKFQDIDVLRLLPKCKHIFHINCLDQWLEKHSNCPLCRNKISADDIDISTLTYSNSLRYLLNDQSNLREDSNIELFVQREESRRDSSRFSITSSFRKGSNIEEDEFSLPIHQNSENQDFDNLNHKIIVSGSVFKHRWSNLSSSDLIFLNSEMLLDMSSGRFSDLDLNDSNQFTQSRMILEDENIENKFIKIKQNDSILPVEIVSRSEKSNGFMGNTSKIMNQRSMSEIVVNSRFEEFNVKGRENSSNNNEDEERVRKIWQPIARRTVQWFANRENKGQQTQSPAEAEDIV